MIAWTRPSIEFRLFDLMADPGETENLASHSEARVRQWRRLFEEYQARLQNMIIQDDTPNSNISPEMAETLRALGYVDVTGEEEG